MLTKFCRYVFCRNFSKSVVWKNLEKKPAEPRTPGEPISQGFLKARKPTEFEKKILIYSGRYKTVEEIPKIVTSETLDNAKTKIRIKIANCMIVVTLFCCGAIIYKGKSERKEKVRILLEKQEAKKMEQELKEAAQKH